MVKGKVIIVSAPSGSGKTTIIKHLLQQDFNLYFSVSATSRKKRDKEINGVDYYFLTVEDFKEKIKQELFLEWEEVYENSYYGTLKSEVERSLNACRNVIFDVDVVGAVNIKKFFNENALSVFIMPPSIEELKQRLIDRSSDKIDIINIRVAKAEEEINFHDSNIEYFDKIIINDKLEQALKEAEETVLNFLNQ